jgi:hypothetical protein
MTVLDINGDSESTWIEYTNPDFGELNFPPTNDITIKFSKSIAVRSISKSTITLLDSSGDPIDAFRGISVTNDYDPLLFHLTLHLSSTLSSNSEYTLFINELYDAAGDIQDRPHSVTFRTGTSIAAVPAAVTESSVINVEDNTLINADLNILTEGSTATGSYTIYMNPTDGAYNVSESTGELTITFSPSEIVDATVTVERRAISEFELAWESVGITSSITSGILTVVLPEVSTGVHIEAGYEYRVIVSDLFIAGATVQDDDVAVEGGATLQFIGLLDPIYGSVSRVLMLSPGKSSYLIAKLLYIYTAKAITIMPALASAQSILPAAIDYVTFGTLFDLSGSSSTSNKYSLGDLTIENTQGETTGSGKWRLLMEKAEIRLTKTAPRFVNKGGASSYTGNGFTSRDFGVATKTSSSTSGSSTA